MRNESYYALPGGMENYKRQVLSHSILHKSFFK